MSSGHQGVHGGVGDVDSAVHSVAASVKVVCLVGFVVSVVATPIHVWWAFAGYVTLLAVVVSMARLPLATLLRRMVVEVPFVLFAVALPFIGHGPSREIAGVSVSVAGLWAAWAILAKATLGTAAAVVLGWTTPVTELLRGLERLHMPRVLVAIAGFMVRYLDVVRGDLARLDVARVSRGDDPRWFFQGRAVAATAGTVFIRSYERGERVHRAMVARGFTGSMPGMDVHDNERWFPALCVPALAALVACIAVVTS